MNRKLIPVAALAAATLWFPTDARAFDMGNAIIGCFGGDSAAANAVVAEAAATCELDGPPLSACNVVSGDPTACATLTSAGAADEICYHDEAKYTIDGQVSAPVGWKIHGSGEISWSATFDLRGRTTCSQSAISPSPEGAGGEFVEESARATALIKMTINGSFTITTPVNATVTVATGASCTLFRAKRGSRKATVSACHARPKCTGSTTGTIGSSADAQAGGDPLQVGEPCPDIVEVGPVRDETGVVGEP